MDRAEAGTKPSLALFFGTVVALSIPFWIWGAVAERHLIPGLPVSGLMAFCPAGAALLLTWWKQGRRAVLRLLARCVDIQRLRGRWRWLAINFALPPTLLGLTYVVMRLAGAPLPTPEFTLAALPLMFGAFLLAGLGEELGWFGYAYGGMEEKLGALNAALVLGAFWAAWHIIPYLQTGRAADWVAWHALATLALRVVAVWLFVNTGRSILAAACFHATCNVAYYSFPNGGSHYDAAFFAPIIVATTALVALAWGPRTLTGRTA